MQVLLANPDQGAADGNRITLKPDLKRCVYDYLERIDIASTVASQSDEGGPECCNSDSDSLDGEEWEMVVEPGATGKCYVAGTLVPVSATEYKKVESLKVGDTVFSSSGIPLTVAFQKYGECTQPSRLQSRLQKISAL